MQSPVLTIITSVTPSYRYSIELQLCFKMVRSAFPENTRWLVHQPNTGLSFREFILQHLPLQGLVVFIREPALLIGCGLYQRLKCHLDADNRLRLILPSDVRGNESLLQPGYLTLRGFESFAADLAGLPPRTLSYDKRVPWLFMLYAAMLTPDAIPEDPLELPRVVPADQVAIATDAYIHPFVDYYQESRAEIVPFIPEGVTTLLDIGCSRGGFGAAIKAARKCRVAGVEMNAYEAEAAGRVLDRLWIGDLFSLDIPETFDCVSCLDVLEHFSEPALLLQKIRTLLHPGGTLVITVPNVGHWSVVEDLLAGRWDYVPVGIICTTHLRFYTRSSLLALLDDNGFMPLRVEPQRVPVPDKLRQALTGLQQAGYLIDEENLTALQYIVVARIM